MAARRIGSEAEPNVGRGRARSPGLAASSAVAPDDTWADDVLVAQTARSDGAAYRVLVDRYLAWVMGIARAILGDEAEAEDIAQEAMIRLWRNAGALQIDANGVKPWLRRVTSNLCLDRLRALKSKATSPSDNLPETPVAATQLTDLSEQDLSRQVDLALAQLPARQKLALVLFHFDGLSVKEIMMTMEISQDGVESLLARGRRRLKELLKDEWKNYLPDPET